jgi:hypothetical protein
MIAKRHCQAITRFILLTFPNTFKWFKFHKISIYLKMYALNSYFDLIQKYIYVFFCYSGKIWIYLHICI